MLKVKVLTAYPNMFPGVLGHSVVGKALREKKWSLEKFDTIMKSKKRILCAPAAPYEGLFLTRIIY